MGFVVASWVIRSWTRWADERKEAFDRITADAWLTAKYGSSWDDAKVIWPNQVLEVAVSASRSVWCASKAGSP
jgi:hypothetical protein